jgi:TPR repeat protein
VVPGQDREQPGSAAAEAVASYDLPAPRTADTPDPPEAVKAVKLEKATSPPLVTIETLIRRADIMISRRDISAARLLYRRAAVGGSHHAMLALGKTYDPFFLAEIGARGTMGDVATAIDWYQRAFALGANDAWERLALHGIHLE